MWIYLCIWSFYHKIDNNERKMQQQRWWQAAAKQASESKMILWFILLAIFLSFWFFFLMPSFDFETTSIFNAQHFKHRNHFSGANHFCAFFLGSLLSHKLTNTIIKFWDIILRCNEILLLYNDRIVIFWVQRDRGRVMWIVIQRMHCRWIYFEGVEGT